MLHSEGLEKWQGHRVLAIFGAFRILRVGGTHVQLRSQNTKFISLSRSLTAYRNLLLDFFKKLIKTSLFFCNFIIYNK